MANKNAGAGRGFVNPQRTDESDEDYVTPKARYDAEKASAERKESDANEAAYMKSMKYSKGGVTRADGCVTKGHTKGKII